MGQCALWVTFEGFFVCLFSTRHCSLSRLIVQSWLRRSNFHHQASPRATTQEHPAAEGGTVGKKFSVILPK